MTLYSAVETLL